MTTLLEMLNASEVREDDENFKNAVDLTFILLDFLIFFNHDYYNIRTAGRIKEGLNGLCK